MAEKVETILNCGIFTTRPRYFYDVYILGTTQKFDKEILNGGIKCSYIRGSFAMIAMKRKKYEKDMLSQWRAYGNDGVGIAIFMIGGR